VSSPDPAAVPHSISVVVPVYQGELTLPDLLAEIDALAKGFETPGGVSARIGEVLLVHDHGPDASDVVIRALAEQYEYVRPVWLSRNYGQHAATLAGMASSGGDWIVTLDEDGQYDPADIGTMLDEALAAGATVVYARPVNLPPHGSFRNLASRASKRVLDVLVGGTQARSYHSFRLVLGEVGRSVAAYAGSGVYLDVALGWVAGPVTTAPVTLRDEGDRRSGYDLRRLLSHFWRMVLTSGTRGLRMVSVLGVALAAVGMLLAVAFAVNRMAGGELPQGWTSLIVVILVTSGLILFCLGVVAEYIGVAVNMAMGKPLYLIVSDPADGPLGRAPAPRRGPRQ
jgi:undecaprenyl-phosphate 4-deoxy-4-formamido-L-arabinose transferase